MALYKNEELQVIDVLQEKLNCHKSPTQHLKIILQLNFASLCNK